MKQNNSKKFVILYEYRKKHGKNVPAECWVQKSTVHHLALNVKGHIIISPALRIRYKEVAFDFGDPANKKAPPAMVPVSFDPKGYYEIKFLEKDQKTPLKSSLLDPVPTEVGCNG